MNQINFRTACAAATVALLAPCAAQAQQTADVDALASLEPAGTPLTVRGAGDLQFGLITIPNTSSGSDNVVCAYNLGVNTSERLTVRNILEGPFSTAIAATTVTPSGCEFRSVPVVAGASFEIICAPSVVTNFQISWNASTADPALNFVPPSFGLAGLFTGGTSTVLPDAPGGSASSGAVACPAGGAIDVLVGGTLRVQQTAIAAANASVGSVSLSVNY